MKVAMVLNLSQSPTQDEGVFRKVANECYLPLLRFLKSKKQSHFTLNIPLEVLEQMDMYGYNSWLRDLRDLYKSERITLTGSTAYSPKLDNMNKELLEQQIILNEYGMGYYLGERNGFEGEPSIMLKNCNAFVPTNLEINNMFKDTVFNLGYKLLLVDRMEKEFLKNTNDKSDMTIVEVGSYLNTKIQKNTEITSNEIAQLIKFITNINKQVILYVDINAHNTNYNEICYFLDVLEVGVYDSLGPIISINDVDLDNTCGLKDFKCDLNNNINIKNTENDIDMLNGDKDTNDAIERLVALEDVFKNAFVEGNDILDTSDYTNIPFWRSDSLAEINDNNIRKRLYKYILFHKFLNCYKFIFNNKQAMFDTLKSLEIAIELSQFLDEKESKKVNDIVDSVKNILNKPLE